MDYVDLAIGITIAASVIPGAISAWNDANTTGWSTTTVALWGVGAVAIIAGIVKRFLM